MYLLDVSAHYVGILERLAVEVHLEALDDVVCLYTQYGGKDITETCKNEPGAPRAACLRLIERVFKRAIDSGWRL